MKKFHVKLNRVLAVTLSALMCLSLPMDHVLADTVSQGDETEQVTENTLPAGVPVAQAADDMDLFNYDGETATEGVLGMTREDYQKKTGALKVPSQTFNAQVFPNEQVTETVINSGTVVFDVEVCPMGAAQESVVFANSKGDILFVVSVDSETNKKFYLADTANATAGTEIGTYNENCWSRIKAELDLDAFTQGKLQFKVSVTTTAKNAGYTGEWSSVGSVTQEDLKTDNGTVTALIDGSAEHPYDLGSVSLTHKSNSSSRLRYFGDIHLYKENNVAISEVELSGELPVQAYGTAFNPGDAALAVTDVNGDTVTKKLSEMVYDVDYTVSGYTAETPESDEVPITITYKGFEVPATVAVKNVVTGIKIQSLPNKTVYDLNESLDPEGLVVAAVMSDKSPRELQESEYEVSALDASASGYYRDITVTYKENESFTASFKVKVEDSRLKKPVFAYTGNEENLEALGFTGNTDKAGLSSAAVKGNETQQIVFNGAGILKKIWDAQETGTVKVNVEFNQVNGVTDQYVNYRLYNKDGEPLFNFVQRGNNGNVNMLRVLGTGGDAETAMLSKKNLWIRLETTIDLDASNTAETLKFRTNAYYKDSYEKDWTYGGTVTSDKYYSDEWKDKDGTLAAGLTEFSVGGLEIESTYAGPVFDNIEVLIQGEAAAVEAKVTGIKVKSEPTKKNYAINETFDKTGLEVELVMSDDTTKPLAEGAYEVSTPDMTTAGTKTVTVTYKEGDKTFTKTFDIKVTDPNQKPSESQSFKYIDEEDISDLEFDESSAGVLGVTGGDQKGNTTNKLSITGGSITKTLKTPITSGKVTLETVGFHNGNILGVQILDGAGKNLINYSQQAKGNLNLYSGDLITGGEADDYSNIAPQDKVSKTWVKVTTEIDLDESKKTGILQFTITAQYKESYTDDEWLDGGSCTQQAYIGKGKANGAADSSLSSFTVGAIRIGMGKNEGTGYMDDILFNDGNGIEGILTVKEKVLKSIAITTEAATKEFVQDSKISTEGLVLTGTYDVTYSDGHVEENKTYKITKYDVECDTSQVAESVPVTLKVTDNGQEFTATYNVKITPKPDGSYVTFSYTDESGVAQTGFGGSKIKVASGDTYGNTSKKIQLDKGDSTMTLADPCTTGTVHFETEFLTTSTSGASLFLRILNSEGKPMVDIAQYGSGNLNLYIDKKTSGTDGAMAGQFKGLPVKQWAKLSVDIDLDRTKEEGHLMFDAIVWTKADYAGDWSIHAEYDQDLYLKSTMAPTTTGSASSDATVLDVASIELVTSNGTSYYDNMFFEAIRGDVAKELTRLWIEKFAEKTEYTVGDGLNRTGLVLKGIYRYSFQNGDVKEREAEITKYDISFDNTQPGDTVPVTLTAGGLSVSYEVLVRPNTALDDIEEYLVKEFINNKLVTLDDWNVIHMNKRQVKLPIETRKGEKLTWSIDSGNAMVSGAILTVNPSKDGGTEVGLKVTLSTTNNDGDPVNFSKTLKIMVPKESGRAADDSFATEESLRYAVKTLYDRNIFRGQAELTDVDTIMGSLDREIKVEEIAAILVNLFNIDTTYADARISRSDVEDDAWYSKFVKAAFQLSVETRDSREGKQEYGIGKGISKANLLYMIDRIIHIDQTTMPDDYQERMFE